MGKKPLRWTTSNLEPQTWWGKLLHGLMIAALCAPFMLIGLWILYVRAS